MGAIFTLGEKKKRPGVYQRYENNGTGPVAGATDGIVAVTYKGDWGEIGKVYTLSDVSEVDKYLGVTGTASIVKDIFTAGASKVVVTRLGKGGTKGTVTLKDTTASPKDAIVLTAKCEGTRAFSYTLKPVLGDDSTKEFVLYEGTAVRERFTFSKDGDEVAKLLSAAANSIYFDFAKVESYEAGTNLLATVSVATEITPGTSPASVTNEDYTDAFERLEPYTFNAICVDSVDATVHALLAAFAENMFNSGKGCFAVVGEPTSVAIETRKANAKAFNSYKVVYVGGAYITTEGTVIEGYRAAATVAGLIAKVPSSQSVTHYPISGAVDVKERLTNTQYEECIDNGMLTFSVSDNGTVWIDSGITTLTTLTGEDDEGWKKIKRTKIRFELMQRTNETVSPLIGQIPNNTDGQTNVIEVVQKLLDEMVAEIKLHPGASVGIDPASDAQGDSVWFVITADDIDAIEKIYNTFKFRFTA